jgi:plasmid stability protein
VNRGFEGAGIDSIAVIMSTITVRQLPDKVKQRLRVRAAENGRSMEAEVREILVNAVAEDEPNVDLTWVEALIALGDEFGGIHLEIPPREEIATAWDFGPR